MCGSGSTIFAIVRSQAEGETLQGRFRTEFGEQTWSVVCPLNPGSLV
jgi:4-diphosphocytidyl-2C-methyl-D-erythritol kinase